MSRHRAPIVLTPADVQVETHGTIAAADAADARAMVAALTLVAHEPVLRARVRLTASANPAVARPYTARANLELAGRLIYAEAAAATAGQAVHLLRDRLRARLRRTARDWSGLRGRHYRLSRPAH